MRAAVYTRISLDPERDSFSPERQEHDARALAESRGWTVVTVYEDRDRSAFKASRTERPEYVRMLEAVKAGEVDVVIADSISRLCRRVRDFYALVDLLAEHKVSLVCVKDHVDTSTAMGQFITGMFAGIAEMESSTISQRVKASHRVRRELGRMPAGRYRHYGYTRAGEVVPAEASLIRAAADRVVDGESLHSVARWLNERGAETTAGNEWTGDSLSATLTSGRLAALRRDPESGEMIPGGWEPVFSEADYLALSEAVANRYKAQGRRRRSLLSGLVLCGKCGERMHSATTGRGGKPRLAVYACKKRARSACCGGVAVTLERLDEYVVSRLLTEMGSVLERSSPGARVEHLEAELGALESSLAGLDRARFVTGSLPEERWRPLSDELRSRAVVLTAELEVARSADLGTADLHTWWANAGMSDRARMLRSAVHSVTVLPCPRRGGRFNGDERVRIRWSWSALLGVAEAHAEPEHIHPESTDAAPSAVVR